MIAPLSLVLAISFTIGPGQTIQYPQWAVDPVKEKYIPYPLFDAYDKSTGGWTSGRITDSLGTAMYGSLDAILQRRIFPYWYPWGMGRTLTIGEVCSTDFMPPATSNHATLVEYVTRSTSPMFYEVPWSKISAVNKGQVPDFDDPLGIYTYATNRNFTNNSVRIYTANAAADYAITNDMIGLVASFDKSGRSAAHYWMNPASLEGLSSTDFSMYPLPHDGWNTNLFLFVGDYVQTNFFPASLFSRDGYAEMRGIHPEWARKFYASMGYSDTFASIFSADAQQDGGRIATDVSSLINGGKGVGLIKNVYRRKPTPRIVLDRFALLNSAASLCQTAFLGTQETRYSNLSPNYEGVLFPTEPVPHFAFRNRKAYHGTLIYTNTLPSTVDFIPSIDTTKPEDWTAKFDVNSMFSAAKVRGSDLTFETEDLTVVTSCTEKVTAAWYDDTVYVSLSAMTSFDLKRSDFTITFPTTGILDNPFVNDPDAAKGTWQLDTIVGERGDVTWHLKPDYIQTDDGWVLDPKAVFSDGSTTKQIGQGTLSFKDSKTAPMDFHFTWRLNFHGRDLPQTVAPFVGPTCYDRKGDSDYSWTNTFMSVTYSPELYSADIVETWIDAYTTVGLSAHLKDVANLLDDGTLDFTDGIDDRTRVFSKYTAAPYHIGSTIGWQNTWMSLYSPSEMKSEIDECIGYLKMDNTNESAAISTYLPSLDTCLAGYGGAADMALAEVKRLLAAEGSDGVYPADYTITPRSVGGITNGEIPYDFVCGSIRMQISIPVTAENARRSSVAVEYVKQGLPFAEFKFPAMSLPSAATTSDGTSGTAGSTE